MNSFKFKIISKTIDIISNPFIIEINDNIIEIDNNIIYCIHTANLAVELFDDFSFINKKIRKNIFWFDTELELEQIIIENLNIYNKKPKIIIDLKELDLVGNIFYLELNNIFLLLNNNSIFYIDISIFSKLNGKNINNNYIIEDNYIGFKEIKILLKENGLLDEIYSENNFINFLSKYDCINSILFYYQDLWNNKVNIKYNIDNVYNNPYNNLLKVEDYLNKLLFYNIDIDKCHEYDLKYSKLPAKYNFSGFYNTTGRIYCSSDNWTPLQNINKTKRDILYAEKDCIFIEFDYKSFEFDILCQLINISIEKDPHTATYNKYVNLPNNKSREIGKMINYSFIYGMNEKRLAEAVIKELENVPENFKEKFIENLSNDNMIKKVKDFEEELKNKAINNTIKNYFGRNIHFKKGYAILNNYISSSASDFLYNKFLFLLEILEGKNKIILQNHDSILIQLLEKDIEHSDLLENILKILNKPISGITGRIDYKYGKNWKEMN